jgi:hypothetical protein
MQVDPHHVADAATLAVVARDHQTQCVSSYRLTVSAIGQEHLLASNSGSMSATTSTAL